VFRAECERSAPMAPAEPGSLEFFLVERYVLFAGTTEHLLRARIHHRPWPLQRATLIQLESNMLAAQGLETPDRTPLVHAQRQPFDVSIWAPTVVAAASRDS